MRPGGPSITHTVRKPNDIEAIAERPLPATSPPARAARPRLKMGAHAGTVVAAGIANPPVQPGFDDGYKQNT